MTPRTWLVVILSFSFCLSSPANKAFANASEISIGTGGIKGVYYPTGGAIARMLNNKQSLYGFRIAVKSTKGSVSNINGILAGNLDLGIAHSNTQYAAVQGQAHWRKQGPQRSLRALFSIYSETVCLIAADDAGIDTIWDLKGKRVAIGNPGSGMRRDAIKALTAAGIDWQKEQVGYLIPAGAELELSRLDLIEYEAETINLNDIKLFCKNMRAKHIALVLDSCFSGLAMKRSLQGAVKMDPDYYRDLLKRRSLNLLTAGDDQPVSDGSDHSPFAMAIINALQKKNIDLNDKDGYATFTELSVYVKKKVEQTTKRRQRPQFDNLSMDDGDLIFKF